MNRISRRTALSFGGLALGALPLAGCGGLLPNSGPAPDLFTLTPKSTFRPDLPNVAWQLVVEEPLATGGLDSNRIAIQPTPIELKYYAEARWSERAPRMVQSLMVESFENTRKIVAVGRQSVGLRSDYNLKSELREFQAELGDAGKVPTVRVRLNLKLVRQPRQEIVASRSFEVKEPAKTGAIRDVVVAFDEALGRVMRRAVEWTLVLGQEKEAAG
jgi:cholesterol transport system auxiliary component